MKSFFALLTLLVLATVSHAQATATASATATGRQPVAMYVPTALCQPTLQTVQTVPCVQAVQPRARMVRVPVQIQAVPCAEPPIAIQSVPVQVVQTVPMQTVQTVPVQTIQAAPVCTCKPGLLANRPLRTATVAVAEKSTGFLTNLFEKMKHLLPHRTIARSRAVTRER